MESPPNQCLELEVVAPKRRGGNHGGGARLKLDVKRFKKICRLIEQGQSHVTACQVEGISYALFRLRVTKRPWWRKRLAQAERVRYDLRYEWHMANITEAAERDPRLSAIWLDRHGWRFSKAPQPGSPGFECPRGYVAIPGAAVIMSEAEYQERVDFAARLSRDLAAAIAAQPPEPPEPDNVIDIEAAAG